LQYSIIYKRKGNVNALNAIETETETLVNLVNHPVLGPTASATEGRTPPSKRDERVTIEQVSKHDLPGDIEQEEHDNHIGFRFFHHEKQCVTVRVNQYKIKIKQERTKKGRNYRHEGDQK
jgi:predicted DNA binding CopG/RHH family protein